MHLPFTPNHVQLITACYPPNAALLTSGPEYRPNSQELSRMTYYASNKPGKINKLASELEKRVKLDSRKAKAGNLRARASLLITLAIVKALAIECRRDLELLSASLLASVNATLSALSTDLEVSARAGSVFTAWTTYTDGHIIEVDQHVRQDYMSCLNILALMGRTKLSDQEVMNRTRLVGLAALTGVVTSEALYNSTTQLKDQISTFIPALVIPLLEVDISTLDHIAATAKDQPNSPYLNEFRNRPAMERRATSIHLHVTGESGPTSKDVANSAIRVLSALFGHSNGGQASITVQAALDCFNDANAWGNPAHCKWFATHAAEWTQYQYRYAIPTKLVECLVQDQDTNLISPRHNMLATMITSVFTSPTPLINLSTSDIISSLISIVLRRVSKDPSDALLPALVGSIASLGTHVYYADQIQDLAGELISRLVAVETGGVPLGSRTDSSRGRSQAIRCLLAGLLGLIHSAEIHDAVKDGGDESRKSLSPSVDNPGSPTRDNHSKPSRRTNVPTDVWQDTLSLLCDREYAVRSDYAATLVAYLEKEVPRLWDYTDSDGVKRIRPIAEGPIQQANINWTVLHGDNTTRFLNSLHAYAYVLTTSSNLAPSTHNSTPSPQRSVNGDASTSHAISDDGPSEDLTEGPPSRKSLAIPRTRKMSVMQRLLRTVPSKLSSTTPIAATLSDYGNVAAVLRAVFTHLPIRGLLTGLPMLLALHAAVEVDTSSGPTSTQRLRAIQEILISCWLAIGKVWDCPDIVELAEKITQSMNADYLPPLRSLEPGVFPEPCDPVPLPDGYYEGTTAFNAESLLDILASSKTVQEATGLDRPGLLRKFSIPWSAEAAFKDSLETPSPNLDIRNGDALSPLTKVSPFMHIENFSRTSVARSARGVGVTDLREALEGRSSLSNPNLRDAAASISTLEHTSNAHGDGIKLTPVRSRPQQRSKLAGPGEVRDVLNKLGIGRANGSGSGMLRPSFSSKKPEQRIPSTIVPPYKT